MLGVGMQSSLPGLCSSSARNQHVRTSNSLAPSARGHCQRRCHSPFICRAQVQEHEEQQAAEPAAAQELGPSQRRRVALGSEVVESDEAFPEPPASDFWEGEAWDWTGKLAIVIVPILVALAVGVGLFAAATYNEGADKILTPAGVDTPAQIIDK